MNTAVAMRKSARAKAARDQDFSTLDSKLHEYEEMPSTPADLARGAVEYLSRRIQKPNGDFTNQFRNHGLVKGGGSEVHWSTVTTAAAGPPSRVGMTLTRLGAGHSARLVLYGGLQAPTPSQPQGGFASSDVELFDPTAMRWCTPIECGEVRGRPLVPRAGHVAAALGRHLLIVHGGRTESGLSGEMAALAQYRSKAAPGENAPESTLLWSRPKLGSPAAPSARAHHAMVRPQ